MSTISFRYRLQAGPEQIFVSSKEEVVIGRDGKSKPDLELSPDLRVSRPHARVFYHLSTWWVEDLNSAGGTLLNGNKVTQAMQLSPGDQLQIGNTVLTVTFEKPENNPTSGVVEHQFVSSEAQPPPGVPEDERIKVLVKISQVVGHTQSPQEILAHCLQEIRNAFPKAERGTILLIEDNELVARNFWPPPEASVSFTLARKAIQTQQAFLWRPQPQPQPSAPVALSLVDTRTALYAPMLFGGSVVGVLHVDATDPTIDFSEQDLQLLSVVANTIGGTVAAAGAGKLPRLPNVFLSYAHKDREFVDRLAADLRRRSVKVWFDERLKSGEVWRRQLATAIETTNAFVLVLSPASVGSKNVLWELDIAQAGNKKIFPLMYQPCDVPNTILSLHYIPMESNYDRGIDQLVDRLYEMLQDLPVPPIPASESNRREDSAQTASPANTPVSMPASHILHLSDLHFGTVQNARTWCGQLAEDLRNELRCDHLDLLILSGDLADRATETEYAAAKLFVDEFCEEFQLDSDRIVLVPGNHDVGWAEAKRAYRLERREDYQGEIDAECVIDRGEIIEVRDEEAYKQRFARFSTFYKDIKGEAYALDYDQQVSLHHFPDQSLLLIGLNSAWQLDHHYTYRAGIDPSALTHVLRQIRLNAEAYGNCLKIAVWHHPISSPFPDRITDHGFVEQLAKAGFRFGLHGHIHKADNSLYAYDRSAGGRRIDIICAGTFGAPVRQWTPGYPLQYNLLKVANHTLTVETRRREELNGAWKPDARWTQGAGRDPLPRYTIEL